MLEAIKTMHDKKMVHTDLKPSNFLISQRAYTKLFKYEEKYYYIPDVFNVTLIDFGNTVPFSKFSNRFVGAKSYRAPEIIMGNLFF